MATSILLACGLNEQHLQPITYLSEESGVDGTFLISSILGQRVRVTNSGTILVCLHQTFAHYTKAGIRLGSNLQMSHGKNLHVIDILNDISDNFPHSKWLTTQNLLQLLWEDIQLHSSELLKIKAILTIIIDDLSALLNLGASSVETLRFCSRLRNWCEEQQGNVAIVMKLNTSDVYEPMSNQMEELSDIHVTIERLKSGNFKEVDGKILVRKATYNDDSLSVDKSEKHILYKVLDRNIKIFNPGEVGIKV